MFCSLFSAKSYTFFSLYLEYFTPPGYTLVIYNSAHCRYFSGEPHTDCVWPYWAHLKHCLIWSLWSNRRALYKAACIIFSFYITLCCSACVGKFNIYVPIFFGFLSTICFSELPPRRKILLITQSSTLIFISLYISWKRVVLLVSQLSFKQINNGTSGLFTE